MNILKGTISVIQSHDGISLIEIAVGRETFTTIILETPQSAAYLKIGNTIKVYFKETEVIIAKNEALNISMPNKIPCKINSINDGAILSELHLSFGDNSINSIITTQACKTLNLKNDDTVLVLIQANEISISE